MIISARLKGKEVEIFRELKHTSGLGSDSEMIKTLITKRRVTPNVSSDMAKLYMAASSIVAKAKFGVRLVDSKEDLVDLAEQMELILKNADDVLAQYSYAEEG